MEKITIGEYTIKKHENSFVIKNKDGEAIQTTEYVLEDKIDQVWGLLF